MEHFNVNKFINGKLSCNLLSFDVQKSDSTKNQILYDIFIKATSYSNNNNKEKFKETVGHITIIGRSLQGLYQKINNLDIEALHVEEYESVKSVIYKTQYQQFYLREKFPDSKSIVYIDLDEIGDWSNIEEIRTMFRNAKNWIMQCFIICRNVELVFQQFYEYLSTWIFCDEFSEFENIFLLDVFDRALRQNFEHRNHYTDETIIFRVLDEKKNKEIFFDKNTTTMIKQFQRLHFLIIVQFSILHDSQIIAKKVSSADNPRDGKTMQRLYFL